MELGAPITQSRHALTDSGMTLGSLRRLGLEEAQMAARFEVRRIRENMVRDQIAGLRELAEEEGEPDLFVAERRPRALSSGETTRQGSIITPDQRNDRVNLTGNEPQRRSTELARRPAPTQIQTTVQRIEASPLNAVSGSQARLATSRSSILAARQARGRSGAAGGGGSRDSPLVVLSDSE
jgi:hypothetical protein